jgi:hypothetical protein
LRTEILEEKLRDHDGEISTRLRRAAIVLYGRVESVQNVTSESPSLPSVGEAAPSWRIADLLVWRVLKGQPPSAPRVVFAYQRTQKWSEMPVFVPGQEGLWLLHSLGGADGENTAWRPPHVTDGFEAPAELDFHAPSALPRIHLLLQLLETPGRRP